jgi:AraC-like DNA-binding protein
MSAVMRNIQDCKQCIFTADDNIQRLFSDICDTFNTSMLRIKVLELIILMGEKRSPAGEKSVRIRKLGNFICENLCDHYTIAQLSRLFEIDRTTLKKLFRRIFGCPVYTYAKNRKMFRAAELLRDTEMKVIDIAEEVGYCNASKFSSAFRDVIGTAPKNYQTERKTTRKHKKRQIPAKLTY